MRILRLSILVLLLLSLSFVVFAEVSIGGSYSSSGISGSFFYSKYFTKSFSWKYNLLLDYRFIDYQTDVGEDLNMQLVSLGGGINRYLFPNFNAGAALMFGFFHSYVVDDVAKDGTQFVVYPRVMLGYDLAPFARLSLFTDFYALDNINFGLNLGLSFGTTSYVDRKYFVQNGKMRPVLVKKKDNIDKNNSVLTQKVAVKPFVVIISPQNGVTTSELKTVLELEILHYGQEIDKIRVLLNGKDVSEKKRGVQLVTKNSQSVRYKVLVSLQEGKNSIEVFVYNKKQMVSEVRRLVINSTGLAKRTGKDYALLIATDKYDDDMWADLSNPINDVVTIGKTLKDDYGFKVKVVKNPTKLEILKVMRSYAKMKFSSQDQLLVFFAGHGYFDSLDKRGFLVARDTKSIKEDEVKQTYISHANLKEIIGGIPCKHTLLMMDVCFGGTIDSKVARGSGSRGVYTRIAKDKFVSKKVKLRTLRYITSGGKEYVPDGRPGHHSPFARRIIEALRSDRGKWGMLTLVDIFSYLQRVSPTPLHGEFSGNQPGSDFMFIVK